jgi:hypothetical protein
MVYIGGRCTATDADAAIPGEYLLPDRLPASTPRSAQAMLRAAASRLDQSTATGFEAGAKHRHLQPSQKSSWLGLLLERG